MTAKNADRIVTNLKLAARLGGQGGTYTGDATASDDDSKCSPAGPDIWFMCLIDRSVARSYHPWDYD